MEDWNKREDYFLGVNLEDVEDLRLGPMRRWTRYQLNSRMQNTLIKKKLKFSSYVRKFRVKQLQSHI
jgi:hypothetical protein